MSGYSIAYVQLINSAIQGPVQPDNGYFVQYDGSVLNTPISAISSRGVSSDSKPGYRLIEYCGYAMTADEWEQTIDDALDGHDLLTSEQVDDCVNQYLININKNKIGRKDYFKSDSDQETGGETFKGSFYA